MQKNKKNFLTRVRNGMMYALDLIIGRCMPKVRKYYQTQKAKRLENANPTIISNNCTAGIIYHDLGLQFRSPTVNLWFSDDDYFEFLDNLDFYVRAVPEETVVDGINYPVGKVRRGEHEILIYFMHYDSFDEACKKWTVRAERMDWKNMYVIFNHPGFVDKDSNSVKRFLNLKYDHKVMLTNCGKGTSGTEILHMPVYEKYSHPGVILEYKSWCSIKRWLDDFDYVSFLNQRSGS